MQRTGGVTFQVRAGSEYFDLGFPKKINQWRKHYIYVRETTPAGQVALPVFSLEWSRPRNLNAAVQEKDRAVVDVMRARLHEMKTQENLKGINLVTVWKGRHIAPLAARPTPMCHYAGLNDDSCLMKAEWRDGEFEPGVQKVTDLSLASLKGTKKPYCSKNPPPPVSFTFLLLFSSS
jgi:hypothetical protein